MNEFEAYKEHIQHTHDAFCKIVIRHAAIDAARMLKSKWSREISLEYLTEEKYYPFQTSDQYFVPPEVVEEEIPFTSCGLTVLLDSPALAAALSALPEQKQEMIFLYYFHHQTHARIGERYGRKRSSTGRQIHNALRQLREEMEGADHEQTSPL